MADTNDVLSLTEAKLALHINNTNGDTNLGYMITAVSAILDENCGPIVQRIETNSAWTGGAGFVHIPYPIHAIGTVTDYTGTTGTALTADSHSAAPTAGYRLEERRKGTGNYTGTILRTASGAFANFGERVVVNATFGRYANTASVHPKFKEAGILILKNLFRSDEISVGSEGDFAVPFQTFPASYAVPNSVRDLLGDDWLGRKDVTLTGVMFG